MQYNTCVFTTYISQMLSFIIFISAFWKKKLQTAKVATRNSISSFLSPERTVPQEIGRYLSVHISFLWLLIYRMAVKVILSRGPTFSALEM